MLRRLVHGLVLSTLLCAFFSIPASADAPYMDALGRYSFVPPTGFTLDIKKSTDGYVAFANADQQATLYIYAYPNRNRSLDDYTNQFISDRKKDTKAQVISEQGQAVTLDGQPGRQIEYVLTTDTSQLHYLITFVLNGNIVSRIYALAPVAAWDTFAPQAATAFAGFHFLTTMYPTTYTDAQDRYSFTIPLGWQRELSSSKSDGTVDGFIGFNPDGNVFIDPLPAETGVTLDQYVAFQISNIIDSDDTIETSQKTASATTVAGLPALQWEFFSVANNVRYHHRLTWLYNGATRYRLNINTRDDRWDAVLPQAMLIFNSLKFA